MRIISLILTITVLVASPVLGADSNGFEDFIKSREVVATLYFNTNAEELSKSERNRLIAMTHQLRQAQLNGRMIRVEGFSSTEGDQETNFILSFFRARSVADIIEAEGLDSEIALTGYGDLRADSQDHAKQRRVEIASYVKPVTMKKIKVAEGDSTPNILSSNSVKLKSDKQEIDSYRVDQAIRSKIENKDGFAEQWDKLDNNLQPGLSQSELLEKEIERSYNLWRLGLSPAKAKKVAQTPSDDLKRSFTRYIRSVTPASSAGLTQSEKADDDLKRGYSQVREAAALDEAPGVTMIVPQVPVIDALMIEQAIMEKIDEPTVPSGSVSRVDVTYQQ